MFQMKLCFSIVSMLMLIQTILSVPIDNNNDMKDCHDTQTCSLNINKTLLDLLALLSENKSNHVPPKHGDNVSNLKPVASNQKYKQLLIKLLQLEIMITERENMMPQQNSVDINTLLLKLLLEMCRQELETVKQNINDSNSQLRQLLVQLLKQQQQQLNAVKSQNANAAATNQELVALLMKLLKRPESTIIVNNQKPGEPTQHVLRPESTVIVNNQNPDVLPQPELPKIQLGRPGVKPAGTNKKLVPVVVDLVQEELDLVEDKLGDVTSVLI